MFALITTIPLIIVNLVVNIYEIKTCKNVILLFLINIIIYYL